MAAPTPLSIYLDKDIPEMMTKYDKFWETPDPEENPYKSKYEGRKLLEKALEDVERLLPGTRDVEQSERGEEMVARLQLHMGNNLYACEEVPGAEVWFNKSLEKYLRLKSRLKPQYFIHIQDVLNQLGMLWCNRQGHAEGMNFLRRAQIMFVNRPQEVRDTCDQQSDNKYTLTIFYLAQAYGGLAKPGLSARFCAETLSRQLQHNSAVRPKEMMEKDPFDCKDWVGNCCSLSEYFSNEGMFWTAEYLLYSAAVMCEKCQEICGTKPENVEELSAEVARDVGIMYATRLKFAKTCTENPAACEEIWQAERKRSPGVPDEEETAGSKLTFRCAADQGHDVPQSTEPIIWDDIFPETVYLEDEEASDNRLSEETVVVDEEEQAAGHSRAIAGTFEDAAGGAAAAVLEVSPTVRLRLPVHFRRLHEIVQRRIARANKAFLQLRSVPDTVSVPVEGEEEGETIETQVATKVPSCAAITFEAIREIFKLGHQHMAQSLSHFVLDGWVTEHVRVLQELSTLYRTLCFWESDVKRALAMMARRAQMLAPLLDQLNQKVYIAFWRQLSFEVGEIYQEMYDLGALGKTGACGTLEEDEEKAVTPKHAAKCNDLARKSIKFYEVFLDSYTIDGRIPEKVEEHEAHAFLIAHLNRARLRTKMLGLSIDDQVEAHKLALREYTWIQDYGRRNPEVHTKPSIGLAQELKLCDEMVGMLPSKLSRLAAKRR